MKNRRTTLIAFVLIAALCVGIGYAALTDTLTIGGTISANANPLDAAVYFTSVDSFVKSHSDATGVPSGTVTSNDTISFTIPAQTLINEGDTVSFIAHVKYDGNVGNITITPHAATGVHVFKVMTDAPSYTCANAGGTIEIKVTVIAGDMAGVANDYSETATLTFTVTTDQ